MAVTVLYVALTDLHVAFIVLHVALTVTLTVLYVALTVLCAIPRGLWLGRVCSAREGDEERAEARG